MATIAATPLSVIEADRLITKGEVPPFPSQEVVVKCGRSLLLEFKRYSAADPVARHEVQGWSGCCPRSPIPDRCLVEDALVAGELGHHSPKAAEVALPAIPHQ